MYQRFLFLSALLLASWPLTYFNQFEPAPVKPDQTLQSLKKGKWVTLFDGTTFVGWHSYLQKFAAPQWKIEGDALTLAGKGGGDLLTDQQYENFELELEWKISEGGNSGIVYHVNEDPAHKTSDVTGPEMQVLDDKRHPNAKQGANRTAGALFDMVAPSDPTACKPAGEWNKVRLIVNQGHAVHYLNGIQVVQYQIGGREWDRLVSQSKFKDWKYFARYRTGHIALQDHGDQVWYRRIRIREL
jgi:hypothetical protein